MTSSSSSSIETIERERERSNCEEEECINIISSDSSSSGINNNKWEGKCRVEIKGLRAEEIWYYISDEFCSIHKWLPAIDTCHLVQGTPGQPGLIRRCANSSASTWAEEKLLNIDTHKKQLTYQVLDNNVGFHNYVATIKVSPLLHGERGCEIEWSYVSDPVEGWKLEDLSAYIDSSLHGMAHNMITTHHYSIN